MTDMEFVARHPDHLEPERSVIGGSERFSDYHQTIRTVLRGAYGNDVILRAVIVPSFSPEWAVGIRSDREKRHSVFRIESALHLWLRQTSAMAETGQVKVTPGSRAAQELDALVKSFPADIAQVPVHRSEAGIDDALAARLEAVWKEMLYQTRHVRPHEKNVISLDGIAYHFAMRAGRRQLSGTAHNPPEAVKPGLLAALAEAMAAHAQANAAATLDALETRLAALETRLREEET